MNLTTIFFTIIPEFFLSHWGQLSGNQWKLRIEKYRSVLLTVTATYSLNRHLSDRSFLTPSISHSIICFLFPSYDVGKLQKYLWAIIFVIHLKHLLLHYDMLFIVPIQLSISSCPFFNLDCLSFCDLHSWKFSPTLSQFIILIMTLIGWIIVHPRCLCPNPQNLWICYLTL